MSGALRRFAKKIVPPGLVRCARDFNPNWLMWFSTRSYSQEGEDIFLNKLFRDQRTGFYVDVGAFHPVQYSNTFLFYKRGWRGINIEPEPSAKALFARKRSRDINLSLGIGCTENPMTMYAFQNGIFNTFNKAEYELNVAAGWPTKGIMQIPVKRLADVLDEHLPRGKRIDFMTIDVEGGEPDVIRSNDWSRFRPGIVCVEILRTPVHGVADSAVGKLMKDAGYIFCAKLDFTAFFRDPTFRAPGWTSD